MGTWLILAVSGPLYALYLRTLSPTIPFEDGGEMISPSFTLGINHPPGYPLYALAGKLESLLPVGDIAFRYNLLSAWTGALGCGIAAATAFSLMKKMKPHAPPPAVAWVAALLGGWLLGTSTNAWWQSVIAEKYAPNLLMNAAIMAGCAAALTGALKAVRVAPVLGLVVGLSAAHHGQTVYFGPAVLLVVYAAIMALPRAGRPRAWSQFALFVLLGMSMKAVYPPVRAATDTPFNWNTPDTWDRFRDYFSAQPYQYRIFSWGPGEALHRLWVHLTSFAPLQLGYPGALLAAWGLVVSIRTAPRVAAVLGAAAATGILYCINFMLDGIAIETYYIPVYMIFAMWAAFAMVDLWRRLQGRSRPAAMTALVLLLGWGGWQVRDHMHGVDRSRHYFAYDFAHALLKSAPPGSVLFTFGDYDMFPIWYVHFILGEQPKVLVLNSNFMPTKWSNQERMLMQVIHPKDGQKVLGKVRFAEDYVRKDPGIPVFFSVIYSAIEQARLLPCGAAYQYVWDDAAYRKADVLGEWRRFTRWRTVRGQYDLSIQKDSDTQTTLSYYAYADYRRAYVLDDQGHHDDAERMYRRALSWPYFFGIGPAAAHASLAQGLLHRHHDPEGAIAEFRLAIGLTPDWLPAQRSLGALLFSLHRYEEALVVFRRVRELAPDDAAAAADIRKLEPFVQLPDGH